MTKVNRGCYTWDDYVSSTKGEVSSEQLAREKERDKKMARMMKQLNIITHHVTNVDRK